MRAALSMACNSDDTSDIVMWLGWTAYAVMQVWYEGGSFMMDCCDVAYNDDDPSDIFTWLGFIVANGSSGRHILSSGPGWALGHELTFYDCHTLETVGVACLKSKEECWDQAASKVGRMHND